jgi:hypothetical protein
MKTWMIIGALALNSSAWSGAAVAQLAPALTPTPVIPSTVTAGQLITAQFSVAAPSAPISWAIGISTLTDTTPSGSWDWVVDEDGEFGVTKATMKAACPTPGVVIPAPTPALNPVYAPFVVPDYGPQVVTMALHVRARQGLQSGCVADGELYKVFVINPAPTMTVTPTASQTYTAGPSHTATRTATPGTPPTSTSTPTTAMTPGSTPVQTPAGQQAMVRMALPVPNPGPKVISFYVDGVADRVTIEFYSYGQTKIAETDRLMVGGWASVPVPALGHGGFLAKVTAIDGGTATSFKIAYLYCL